MKYARPSGLTNARPECPRCARQIEILGPPPLAYCLHCGAPTDIPSGLPAEEPAAIRTAAPGLATVERKYSTIRRALVVEAGVLVIIAGSLIGLEFLADVAFEGLDWLLAAALALGPIPLLLAVGMWLDRFEPEPVWLLARTFLWGAAVAILVSGIINSLVTVAVGDFLAGVTSAPVIEEAMKGLGVLYVFRRRREHLDGVTDGIIYALFVGLGFAVVENIQYYGEAIEKEGAAGLALAVGVRGLLTPFLHPFFTMFTGIGLGIVVNRRGAVRWVVPLAGYLVAVLMHALWNSGIGMLLYSVLFVPVFGIVALLLLVRRRHEQGVLERFVAPEVATGLIDAEAFQRLREGGGTLRQALTSMRMSNHPLHAWREVSHAAYILAMHRYNVVRRWHLGHPPSVIDAQLDCHLREQLRATAGRARE